MSQIKSENTKPELFFFSALDKLKIKYKKHYNLPGKPDIAFPKKKIAVFINGEFWHGRKFAGEKNKYSEFWVNKISENIKRDKKNYNLLKLRGWKVIKIWDKDIKKTPGKSVEKVISSLKES